MKLQSLILTVFIASMLTSFNAKNETPIPNMNETLTLDNYCEGDLVAAYEGTVISYEPQSGCVKLRLCNSNGTIEFGTLSTLLASSTESKSMAPFIVGESYGVILNYNRNFCKRLFAISVSSATCF